MRNLWLIAKHEFRRVVLRRGFLLGTLAIPLGLAALIGLIIVVETLDESSLPIGYVDNAGILDASIQASLPNADERIEIWSFPDVEAAVAALERKEVQAVFLFPTGYPGTRQTEIYYLEDPPSEDVWNQLNDFVRVNLVAALPDEVQQRVLDEPNITVYDLVSHREFSKNTIINIILPFAASVFFFITTMSAAGYMLGVVSDEKENRTMEIIVTSVTPRQLIGGKAIGLLGAALTQLLIYVIAVAVGLTVAAPYVQELQQVTVPWVYLGLMALFFVPAYALITAVMVAIGGAVTEIQQGQQVAGILNLIFMLPLFLIGVLLHNPGHPAIVFLTLCPPTAFMTISLRWGFGTIPVWQLGISWVLLVASTILLIWVAVRIFRVGMLRYGQPLTLNGVVAAIKGS